MFRKLEIKPLYTVPKDNIAKDFYNNVLKFATKFDRTTGYFSAKSLASYSKGLEIFAIKQNSKIRFIISHEISNEDFDIIKKGYELKEKLKEQFSVMFNECLDVSDKKHLSNLAYLISIGIVDIKIALIKDGMFHEKSGIFYDDNENIIYFNGSVNETIQGLTANYESLSVYCNFWDSAGTPYMQIISESIKNFEKLWNNRDESVVVVDAHDYIVCNIEKYNKDKIIYDEKYFLDETIIFDYSNGIFSITFNTKKFDEIIDDYIFEVRIKPYIDKQYNNTFYINNLSLKEIGDIDIALDNKIKEKFQLEYFKTDDLKKFLNEKNLNIDKRANVGISIKNKDNSILDKFNKFKLHISNCLFRPLREQQIWDAFFMYTMKKSANFSVPGSGKTSSVLAVFAMLNLDENSARIIVICPKNSFGSWIDEFRFTFGNLVNLNYFSIQDNYFDDQHKKIELKYNNKKYNLFLFNYESIGKYIDEISLIISDNKFKTLLIFDEAHKIKKYNGTYATHALNVAKNSNWTIVLTGTPIPNKYLDIYNMLNILFPYDYKDFFNFNEKTLKNPTNWEIDNINKKIFPFFCRTTKKQLNVPNPNEDILIYHAANQIEERIIKILFDAYGNNKLALFIRILQLETNPQLLLSSITNQMFKDIFDEDYSDIDLSKIVDYTEEMRELVYKIDISSKKVECIKLIKKLVYEKKPIVLWCIFHDTINSFYKILKEMNIKVERVYGEISLEERQNIVNKFKENQIEVLITNPHTLAESVSLHNVCHDAIYFEYSYNLVHLLQSKDRIHRLGLKESQYTQWYFMHTEYRINNKKYSLSQAIYERLKEKEEIMIESIESNKLETPSTSEDDLNIIFKNLNID